MSIELIAIIITGVISSVDLILTGISMCMNGRCELSCCGTRFQHADTKADLIEQVRRMSVPGEKENEQ